jgi:hypothetical protein
VWAAGLTLSTWSNLVCVGMIIILPSSLIADDSGTAMLHVRAGSVAVDHAAVPSSSALFVANQVETAKDSVATIDSDGSTTTVQAETIVVYMDNELNLDHGSLSVSTARGMRVRVDCLTVVPTTIERTQFTVTDVNGRVTVSAPKNDVYIEERSSNREKTEDKKHSNRVIVHEGEQKTRNEKCAAASVMPRDADKPILSTWEAKVAGGGLIAAGCIFVYCFGSENPLSPWQP